MLYLYLNNYFIFVTMFNYHNCNEWVHFVVFIISRILYYTPLEFRHFKEYIDLRMRPLIVQVSCEIHRKTGLSYGSTSQKEGNKTLAVPFLTYLFKPI